MFDRVLSIDPQNQKVLAILDGLNRRAREELRCTTELVVIPGATHLFEEPGALQEVAGLAADWFRRHVTS